MAILLQFTKSDNICQIIQFNLLRLINSTGIPQIHYQNHTTCTGRSKDHIDIERP